ncbi:MAG: phosphoribosyltransferase [Flavobacteriales bacterium]|nr:phosphoribosyltransferase [Flavobacteriales bacterium]|tara:strand:- start:646 stop:1146 length:501 start_codon:yes stop_codon:yes gene_type:complete
MSDKLQVLNKNELNKKVVRLAWEVYEKNVEEKELMIVGIKARGVELAKRLSLAIQSISNIKITNLDFTIDKRDPLNSDIISSKDIEDCNGKVVILVDDVLNSGRTLSYAAKKLLSVPLKKLSVLVMVDRNHNSYPIKSDHVGLLLSTTLQEHVNVIFGQNEGVYLS